MLAFPFNSSLVGWVGAECVFVTSNGSSADVLLWVEYCTLGAFNSVVHPAIIYSTAFRKYYDKIIPTNNPVILQNI